MADKNATYAQRYYEAALDFFEQGQYEKALEHIKKAIDKSPQNPDYLSTKGVFLHKMNDLSQAIESYMEALQTSPNHVFSRYNLGLIFMKLGKTTEAIQQWESVIRLNPKDVDATFNIAVALSQIGRRTESIPFYEKVIQLHPHHVQAHQNLGIIYRDEHDFAKAKYHLLKLKEADSTYSEVVNSEILKCEEQEFLNKMANSGKIAADFGLTKDTSLSFQVSEALKAILMEDFDRSLKIADEILAQDPAEMQTRVIKGQALHGLGRTNDAIAEFMAVIAENPGCADAFFQLGTIFLGLDEFEKALENFEQIKRIDPEFPLIEENISSINMKLLKRSGKS